MAEKLTRHLLEQWLKEDAEQCDYVLDIVSASTRSGRVFIYHKDDVGSTIYSIDFDHMVSYLSRVHLEKADIINNFWDEVRSSVVGRSLS